ALPESAVGKPDEEDVLVDNRRPLEVCPDGRGPTLVGGPLRAVDQRDVVVAVGADRGPPVDGRGDRAVRGAARWVELVRGLCRLRPPVRRGRGLERSEALGGPVPPAALLQRRRSELDLG